MNQDKVKNFKQGMIIADMIQENEENQAVVERM